MVVSWNFKWKKSLSSVLWIFDPYNKCCARTFLCLLLPHYALFQSKIFYHNVILLFVTNNQAFKQSNHHHITWNKTKNNCFKGSQKICLRWIRPVCCMCLSGHSPLNFHVIFIQSSLFREREFSQTGVAASAILIFTNLVYINI